MSVLSFPYFHSQIVWANWLAQFEGKGQLEDFVKSIASPLDILSVALDDMTYKRGPATAEGIQLDGVGIIVGQPRAIQGAFLIPFFGYEGQPSVTGYDQARYRRLGESNEDVNSRLGDLEYRKLIMWKIAVNSASGTIPDIIRALRIIFPEATKIIVTSPAPRAVDVRVQVSRAPSPLAENNLLMFIPKAAGVRVTAQIEIV